MANDSHLGDGVYINHDGYYFNIAVNHHTNHVASFEDAVILNLVSYVAREHPALGNLIKERLNGS